MLVFLALKQNFLPFIGNDLLSASDCRELQEL